MNKSILNIIGMSAPYPGKQQDGCTYPEHVAHGTHYVQIALSAHPFIHGNTHFRNLYALFQKIRKGVRLR